MIPNVKLTVPVPYEEEYASSPVALEPSYRRGIREIKTDVSLEYAAFLIEVEELDFDDYIAFIHDTMKNDCDDKKTDRLIRDEVDEAVRNNRTTWEDWV